MGNMGGLKVHLTCGSVSINKISIIIVVQKEM